MDILKDLPVWVVWKKEAAKGSSNTNKGPTRFTKIPYQTSGHLASVVDPSHWSRFEEVEAAREKFSGIGFVISQKYPLLCFDFDHCIKEGEITREDLLTVFEIADTYTELSPSGDGLHIIFELEEHFPLVANKKVNDDGTAVEAYTQNRYFTYTGNPYKEKKAVRKIGFDEAHEILRMLGYPWGKKEEKIETVSVDSQIYVMTNEVLLEKMFKAKNGSDAKKLYNGDISKYNNDPSAADAAFCTMLAFWTAKNAAQMEEIWLKSPLGQREKTQKRQDYRLRTIQSVIPLVTKVYEENVSGNIVKNTAPIQPTLIKEIKLDGENSKQGIPHKNLVNLQKIMEADSYLVNTFRYNTFSMMVETNIENGKDWVPFEMRHALMICLYIQNTYNYFENLNATTVEQAVMIHAMHHQVNPPQELIKGVKWDEKPRINFWLTEVFGVEATELNQAIASNWIKGLVNRVCTPGCQFDTVLVLEGAQGIGKSSVLRALAEPWHAETTMDIDTKDFQLILTQNIVVEFSEGATLSRSESKSLKQKITEREDNFRRPYDKLVAKFPRRCVFAMTTNENQYLKDTTGNRRWLPVACPERPANVDWIIENKNQMFAEAYHRVYELGETTYDFPKEELMSVQLERLEEDPWIEAIIKWYFDELTDQEREDGVTSLTAYSEALYAIAKKEFTTWQGQRVADIFKNELGLDRRRTFSSGQRLWRFFATSFTDEVGKKRKENLSPTELKEQAEGQVKRFWNGDKPAVAAIPKVDMSSGVDPEDDDEDPIGVIIADKPIIKKVDEPF